MDEKNFPTVYSETGGKDPTYLDRIIFRRPLPNQDRNPHELLLLLLHIASPQYEIIVKTDAFPPTRQDNIRKVDINYRINIRHINRYKITIFIEVINPNDHNVYERKTTVDVNWESLVKIIKEKMIIINEISYLFYCKYNPNCYNYREYRKSVQNKFKNRSTIRHIPNLLLQRPIPYIDRDPKRIVLALLQLVTIIFELIPRSDYIEGLELFGSSNINDPDDEELLGQIEGDDEHKDLVIWALQESIVPVMEIKYQEKSKELEDIYIYPVRTNLYFTTPHDTAVVGGGADVRQFDWDGIKEWILSFRFPIQEIRIIYGYDPTFKCYNPTCFANRKYYKSKRQREKQRRQEREMAGYAAREYLGEKRLGKTIKEYLQK